MRISVLLICVLLLFSGCTKRYWYRSKIDLARSKRHSMKIVVVNQSSELLDKEFEEVMQKAAIKELNKKGYFELPVDSPEFLFTLLLKVGSFNPETKLSPRDLGLHLALESDTALFNEMYYSGTNATASGSQSQKVKALMILCMMRHYKQGWVKWVCADDLYYFGERRDLGRAEGMVRYLIRIAKDKQEQSTHSISHY